MCPRRVIPSEARDLLKRSLVASLLGMTPEGHPALFLLLFFLLSSRRRRGARSRLRARRGGLATGLGGLGSGDFGVRLDGEGRDFGRRSLLGNRFLDDLRDVDRG